MGYLYQYTFTSHDTLALQQTPALYFRYSNFIIKRYDVSPVSITTTQYKENLLDFLIHICAIIGGVFTVTGLIDAIVHGTITTILQKSHLGKTT